MSAKKILAKLTASLAVTLAAGAAAATLSTAAASAATTTNWVMTGWNIQQLDSLSPATANHFFNTPNAYATGPSAATSPAPAGFAAAGVAVYTSYAQFAADVASHALSPAIGWVMYDPEYWAATPLNEQQNPALYLQQFAQLAHANGLKVIETPGRDLGLVPGSACPMTPGENLDHWFLNCNIAAAGATADILVIQDQVNTLNPAEFDFLYNAAEAQAHAANPQVLVDAEISTTYPPTPKASTSTPPPHNSPKPAPSSTSCRPPATKPTTTQGPAPQSAGPSPCRSSSLTSGPGGRRPSRPLPGLGRDCPRMTPSSPRCSAREAPRPIR
jgi:hypothetical protein